MPELAPRLRCPVCLAVPSIAGGCVRSRAENLTIAPAAAAQPAPQGEFHLVRDFTITSLVAFVA